MHKRIGRWQVGGVLAVVVAGASFWAGASLSGVRADATAPSDLEQAFKKARVDGKYDMLLCQIKVEKDAENYGDFKDYGFSNTPEYADQKDLPAGYWVYVAPYWYIWRDLTAVSSQRAKRNWGPEQATGEPDTMMAGDIVTAWASASQDGQEEWLMLEYGEFVAPTAVLVHETYNPGALYRVTAFRPDGEEVELWKGADPTPSTSDMGVSEIPVRTNFKTNRIKIYLDSPNVPGWNEIDAVGLRDKAKKTHWAVAADASTTYAQPFPAETPVSTVVEPAPAGQEQLRADEQRIQRLEEQVRQLKAAVEELKAKKDK